MVCEFADASPTRNGGVIRLQRSERLEAGYVYIKFKQIWEPDIFESIPAATMAMSAVDLVADFHRYETAIENELYRAVNELEQRMRRGEYVPAPQALDVSVHSGPESMSG
jgi:hypothetical protein